MQTEHLSFRASPALVAALARKASSAGCSRSEYLRFIVRQAVEGYAALPADPSPSTDQPFDRLASAARGSLQAQRELARAAVDMAFEADTDGKLIRNPEICLAEGLVLARLAAAQGDIGDQGLVISMLALVAECIGDDHAARDQLGEAVARAFLVADRGDEGTADALPELSAAMSPEIMRLAKEYAGRIKDRCLTQ